MVEEYDTFAGMDREYVIAKLREHELELKAAGIVHLPLHGSLARGAAPATSDVDLIAEFDTTKHLSLLDMVGLENRLSDLLGAPVDLSPEDTLKEPVAERAARECRSCLLGSRPFPCEMLPKRSPGIAQAPLDALSRWADGLTAQGTRSGSGFRPSVRASFHDGASLSPGRGHHADKQGRAGLRRQAYRHDKRGVADAPG